MRRSRLEQFLTIVVLALLAAGTSWLLRIAEPDRERTEMLPDASPDMVVDHFTMQRFDPTGRRQYVFSARQMRHFTAPERTELDQPQLLFLGKEVPVKAQAVRGHVSANGDVVTLEGDVVLWRNATPERDGATLTTEALTVWPETERVQGRVPVRYEEGADVLVAGRFSADNLAATLHLGDGVTATFTR